MKEKQSPRFQSTLETPPLEFVLDFLYEEDCRVSVIFFNMSEENLARY